MKNYLEGEKGTNRFIRIRKDDLDEFLDRFYQQCYKNPEKKERNKLTLLSRNS